MAREAKKTAYVEVAVPAPVAGGLTYMAPAHLAGACVPGVRALVPLGARTVTGFILGPADAPPAGVKVRSVKQVLDAAPFFPPSMIPFFRKTSEYYLYPLGKAVADALPSGVKTAEVLWVEWTEKGKQALASSRLSDAGRAVLSALAEKGGRAEASDLALPGGGKASRRRLLAMARQGHLSVRREVAPPAVRPKTEPWVEAMVNVSQAPPRQKARRRAVELLAAEGPMALRDLKAKVPSVSRWLSVMEQEREIKTFYREVLRDPLGEAIEPDSGPLELTPEQAEALSRISAKLGAGFSAFLLHGVTGSGKTEVYLQAAAAALAKGLSCVVLVPEIALITQMERRFRARFGERVGVLHSGLTPGERLDQWMRILRGEAPLVVGARSAVFAPVQNPGLFIVDEEHDESYKQDSRLRYNARDLAVLRASLSGAAVVLGSATPSVQSRANAEEGKYEALSLPRRIHGRPFPEVRVVDLGKRSGRGGHPLISPELESALEETLSAKEQALIFLNRRGWASYPQCPECGPVACAHCDITLTFHRSAGVYLCHYCGYSLPASRGCPACGSKSVKHGGLGTERMEEALSARFPRAVVARLDRDVMARRGALVSVLKGVKNREIDILVGTQMITKGHDYPNITLVGILCADHSLGFPDYKAAERTFQVLAQVAGRAGRGERPGRVVLQTFQPDHPCIRAARLQDYEAFYAGEITSRRRFGYPPFARLAQVRVSAKSLTAAREAAGKAAQLLKKTAREDPEAAGTVRVLGPVESPLFRIAGRFRFQILVKGLSYAVFRSFLARAAPGLFALSGQNVKVALDVDPVNML
ncbi:MAG: primosomal protein N' [Deltaproteobacteria bacterium]|nr:primosomal protein N' [Deltaproteobacteria bacterium]